MRAMTLTILMILTMTGGGWGATYVVRPDGTGDYPTIQAAIDAASTDDVIELTDGTFTGSGNRDIHYNGKAITVRSQSGDPEACIIDCQGSMSYPHRGFIFDGNEDLDSILEGVTIKNGYAGSGHGGGGVLMGKIGFPPNPDTPSHPYISNCIFTDNTAGGFGGTENWGGGLSGFAGSSPMVVDCVFSSNSTTGTSIGGGMALSGSVFGTAPSIARCTFIGNAGGTGAGGLLLSGAKPDIVECVFMGNTAQSGAGIYANGSQYNMVDCVVANNIATSLGGGLYGGGYTPFAPTISGCTFYGNSATSGGGMAFFSDGRAAIERTIVTMSPQGEAVYCYATSGVTIWCCDIYGNAGGPGCVAGQMGGSNNFSADAGFCDPSSEDFTLRSESPCAPANSPCGQLVGALPVACSGPLTIDVCPDGSGDFTTIQMGINAAFDGDTVILCDATYTGAQNRDLDYLGKAITVRSAGGDPAACVIDCQGAARGVTFHNGEGSGSVLRDITIRNGYHAWRGGAVACSTASPVIQNMVFENNDCYNGGALTCELNSNPTVSSCRFTGNTATDGGGAAITGGSAPLVTDCVFSQNSAQYDAGALWCISASPVVSDCRFEENSALSGGAVQIQGTSDPEFVR
ncbi:MAG: hypothetical protein GF355_17210, partial [Candidatus Eisenbacteria bacterium]|nr:hypothetical protein [Candidatus Eisenbacteria bacterium]